MRPTPTIRTVSTAVAVMALLTISIAAADDLLPRLEQGLSAHIEAPVNATIRTSEGQLRSLFVSQPVPLRLGNADATARALAVARSVAPAWQVDPEQLSVARVLSPGSGLVHADVVRTIEGIEVAGYPARVSTTVEGELVAITGTIAAQAVTSRSNLLQAAEAVRLVAVKMESRAVLDRPSVVTEGHRTGDATHLRWGDEPARQLAAWQRWLPESDGLHLGWEILYTSEDLRQQWLVWVDGATGRLLRSESLTFHEAPTGLVFDQGSPQPIDSPGAPPTGAPAQVDRVAVPFEGDPIASPSGWVGPQMRAAGNNALVFEDHDNDYGQVTPGQTAEATDGSFDFALELGRQAPAITGFVPAVATNIFYWVNFYHDYLYGLGFDEAAGNFQDDNFGRGGRDGDPLVVFVQQGALADEPQRNNAFMSTPPDGFSPVMGMFVWGPHGGGWFTDSALDADIVLHEYTHGLTGRFGRGWGSAQAGAMNEGNSDFMALNALIPDGADPAGAYPVATYSSQDFTSGIRSRPYSTSTTVNSLTYGSFGDVIGYPEIHADGEIWVQALWEIRSRLIDRHGFSEGRRRVAVLLMDAILLSPPNPSMVEVRDAYLLAELARFGGVDRDALWQAFATRGLGFAAYGGTTGDQLDVVPSDATPETATIAVFCAQDVVIEGTSPQVLVADPSGTVDALEVTTSVGDHESLRLIADGTLETTEIITARGPAVVGDGVVQVRPDGEVTFAAGDATPVSRSVRSLHRVSVGGAGGIEPLDGEQLLTYLVGDDLTLRYVLPFTTDFGSGSAIYVSTNGLLANIYIDNDAQNLSSRLEEITAIAPLWYDLRTDGTAQSDEGVYVAEGDGWVRFRWAAETWEPGYAPGSPMNFACTLYADGRIDFAYGDGNTGFNDAYGRQASPTIGLGYADVSLLVNGYDQEDDLELAPAVSLRPIGGLTSELAIQPLWVGESAELAFTLDSDHPATTVTAAMESSPVAQLTGANSLELEAGAGGGSFTVSGSAPGSTSITLTTSAGEAITVPVEVFDLQPPRLSADQLVVLTGPFTAMGPTADVTLEGTSLTPVGQALERQSFRIPFHADPPTGPALLAFRWQDRTLSRSVTVVDQLADLTMAVDTVQPSQPAPGQRVALGLAGGPTPGHEGALHASLRLGEDAFETIPIRSVLPDGRVLVDIPDSIETGSGEIRLIQAVDDGDLLFEGALTIHEPTTSEVQVLPAAGARVAPGSRITLTTSTGGGLSSTENVVHIRGLGVDQRLSPVADTGTAVSFRLPSSLLPGTITVTPLITLAGVEMAASEVQLQVTGQLEPPSVVAVRAADLAADRLELELNSTVLPANGDDLQMRLASGPRVRWLNATTVSLVDQSATFTLPGELAGGVVEVSVRQRLGGGWTEWSDAAAVVLPGAVQIAAAAATGGANGTVWQTDAAFLNPENTPVELMLTSHNGVSAPTTVPANGQVSVTNLLGDLLGSTGSGPITIEAPGTTVVASRTLNQSSSGTFGQYLPGERATGSLLIGVPVELVGLTENDDSRTNLGLVNASASTAELEIVLRDASGAELHRRALTMAPHSAQQVNRVFHRWAGAQVETGRVSVTLHEGGRVHVYGSVVDNTTGDPTTIPATVAVGSDRPQHEFWVPAAAAAPGVNATVWRTALVLTNTGQRSGRITIELVGDQNPPPISLSLSPGASHRIDDVVGAGGFGIEGSGALRISSTVPMVALARVFNQAESGTFGQVMPAIPMSDGLRGDEVGWLPMLAGSDALRTNIGFVNPTATLQRVRVSYRAASGSELRTDLVTLDAGEWLQLGRVLGTEGFVRVHLHEGEGPVLIYGSVVDNQTGDPTTIPLVR